MFYCFIICLNLIENVKWLHLNSNKHAPISVCWLHIDFSFALFFCGHCKFIYFLAVLSLPCCAQAFSSCGEWGLLFIVVCGLLIAVASLAAEHRL